MKLENRMSLGYVKGRFWVPDTRFEVYANRASYKALLRAAFQAGFATRVEFSYSAQRYHAEIITLERFNSSSQIYFIKHNNAYDPNPMAALSRAIRESHFVTPLVAACCLEIECELLAETYRAAVACEKKLTAVLDDLERLISSVPVMFMHGDVEVSRPTVGELRSKPPWEDKYLPDYIPPVWQKRAYSDEDDDL